MVQVSEEGVRRAHPASRARGAATHDSQTDPQVSRQLARIIRKLKNASNAAERLKVLRLERGFYSMSAAARAMAVPKSIYAQHENGLRPISLHVADRYGQFFGGVPGAVILYGDDVVIYPAKQPKQPDMTMQVPLLGRVNSRGVIMPLKTQKTVELEIATTFMLQAAVINTDAFEPVYYRGDHIFFTPPTQAPRELHNHYVVLAHERMHHMLALLQRSREGWTINRPNKPPVVTNKIVLASCIRWVKRECPCCGQASLTT